MNTQPTHLTIVGRSDTGRPRSYRLNPATTKAARNAAYRRLAVVILGLDVASLASELASVRPRSTEIVARAA